MNRRTANVWVIKIVVPWSILSCSDKSVDFITYHGNKFWIPVHIDNVSFSAVDLECKSMLFAR